MKTRLLLAALGALALLLLVSRRPAHTPSTSPTATAAGPRTLQSAAPGSSDPGRFFRRAAAAPRDPGGRLLADPPTNGSPGTLYGSLTERFFTTNSEGVEVPREVIQAWMADGHTNALDLLAARQVGGGSDLLRLALTNFPNDPRVLLAANFLDDGPEARRDRLDRLKAAAPDNAIGNYLSALDHLKSGRTTEALADLAAAAAGKKFDDYSLDAVGKADELLRHSGFSEAEATILSATTALLPQLAQFKNLGNELARLEKDALQTGNTPAAEALARSGMELARELTSGDGSRTLIGQLVGAAITKIVLRPLDADSTPEFLGGTSIRQFQADVDTWRAGTRENTQFVEGWLKSASDAEVVAYFDHLRTQGEQSATAWVRSRATGTPAP